MAYEQWPYLSILLVLLAAGFGLPIPEDIPLLTGGYLCHAGYADPTIMIIVAMFGVLVADFTLFSLGRRFGPDIVKHRFVRRVIKPDRLAVAEGLFAKHGVKIIFIGRFLPGLRPVIFTAAGVLRVPRWTFLAVDGLAALISVPLLIMLSYTFGEEIEGNVKSVSRLLMIAGILLVMLGFAYYIHQRQKRMLAAARDQLAALSPDKSTPDDASKKESSTQRSIRTADATGQN
jgi:membrane protein DedA with SNARE-associated domain